MNFLITALAVYGLSALICEYDGLFNVFKRLRGRFPGSFLTCVVCTAVWLSVPVILLGVYGGIAYITPLAIVGVVIVLERL